MRVSEAHHLMKSRSGSASGLTKTCLDAAIRGEGPRVFTELFRDEALRAAQLADARLAHSAPRPLEGIPISVKDLFDVSGTVTRAGSRALPDRAPAIEDAWAVQRLRLAGAIIIGKTNMTEFAYSGLGLNPHFGTPANPFERASSRLPGGSSSGAAVSVSDGMAIVAIGTDTGGSVRIPAALCGLVGWKPTAARIRNEGLIALSSSLDSIGPIASDVASCALVDEVLSGSAGVNPLSHTMTPLSGVRLAVPTDLLADDTDADVARAVARTLSALSRAGVIIVQKPFREIAGVPGNGAGALIVAAEAYASHRVNLGAHEKLYDPRVLSRLESGANIKAWQYLDALAYRASSIRSVERTLADFDAWLMPTVSIVAPRITDCDADDDYYRINRLLLRNSAIVNFLDGCAISLPCHQPGEAPVGVTIAGSHYFDHRILALARSIECLLQEERSPCHQ